MSIRNVTAMIAVEPERPAIATFPLLLPVRLGAFKLLPEKGRFTAADFEAFAAKNPELQLEMTKEGEMIIMMPTGFEGSRRNIKLTARLEIWADEEGSGIAVEATAGFILPNGAERSPDAAWVRRERCQAFTAAEREKFLPLCPDFVVELRSRTDRLKTLKAKMEEYIANGAQLGWLIDPKKKKVHVYRHNLPVEVLDDPKEISGEPLLKGFVLKLEGIID